MLGVKCVCVGGGGKGGQRWFLVGDTDSFYGWTNGVSGQVHKHMCGNILYYMS